MKILFITNIPSPYRVEFFNDFGQWCELTVLFEKSYADDREVSWISQNFKQFRGVVLKGKSMGADQAFSFEVLNYLKQAYDCVILTNISSPTTILAVTYLKLTGKPYLFEGDGGFPKNGKGLKERLKRYIIKGARGYLSTAQTLDQYFMTYGASKEKIYRYPFTSLREKDLLSEPVSPEQKQNLKQKLGICQEKMVLSVGQFIYRKGYDILLEACRELPKETGVYIVGGVPTQEHLDMVKESELSNVHFVSFMPKEELKEYYMAADLFVLPTREDIWGLVVNEAMGCGVPVITTDRCVAGLELVDQDQNGYIVPVEDADALAEKMNLILSDEQKRMKFSRNSLEKMRCYTIENMVKRHKEILGQLF